MAAEETKENTDINEILEPGEISEPTTTNSTIEEPFLKFVNELNPLSIIFFDSHGCEIKSSNAFLKASMMCLISRNPSQYIAEETIGVSNNKISASSFNAIARSIRQSQNIICSGQIGHGFFSQIEETTDVFFMLYSLSLPRREVKTKRTIRMIGFVCCNDLSQEDIGLDEPTDKHAHIEDCDRETSEAVGGKTIYIEAICAKIQTLSGERNVVNKSEKIVSGKVGKLLLSLVEQYAVSNNFVQIKLSALGYVINYYRLFGYRHTCGCGDEENEEILDAAEKASKTVLKNESIAKLVFHVEKAIKFIDRTRDHYQEFVNNIKLNLDEEPYDFETLEAESYVETVKNILELLPKPKNKEKLHVDMIEDDISINYFGYYELLRLLTREKFSVSCEHGKISERFHLKDEDGEVIDCMDEGFTMRKCITPDNMIKMECNSVSRIGGKSKNKTRKTGKRYSKKGGKKLKKGKKKSTKRT